MWLRMQPQEDGRKLSFLLLPFCAAGGGFAPSSSDFRYHKGSSNCFCLALEGLGLGSWVSQARPLMASTSWSLLPG